MVLVVVKGESVRLEPAGEGSFAGDAIGPEESKTMSGSLFKMNKGLQTEWSYAYDEISYITAGSMDVSAEGKTYRVNPGDFIYFSKGTNVRFDVKEDVEGVMVTYPHWREAIK